MRVTLIKHAMVYFKVFAKGDTHAGRFLRSIKRETLLSFKSSHKSSKCLKSNCRTCPHTTETDHMISSKGKIVPLKHSLNCHSKGIIYAIKCRKCGIMYVGKNRQDLNTRLTDHRSIKKQYNPSQLLCTLMILVLKLKTYELFL